MSADTPEQPAAPSDNTTDTGTIEPLRVIGIAASAGGLEAVSLLVQNLPQDANAVYVIAQHMSPTHKSVLSTLISRDISLPVLELGPETELERGYIYVTPPNADVVLESGILRLRNPSGHAASPKPSADRLFKSLANEQGENCMGIVLSGTGSDGSYGVQAIREVGGITIAQEPASAKYDGMPTSAIETGCIDLTLSPEQIGTHLEKILAQPRNLDGLRRLQDEPKPLGELFGILLARTQVDFADYKENTLNRRIVRRMTALGIQSYDDYVDYCRTNMPEVDALHRDLLISVTRFFRDPDQFDKLQREVDAKFSSRDDSPIRVWIVGCATGEEAYTIAIILAEVLGGIEMLARRNVQIFATDIDQNAIEVARKGIYPIAAASDIPAKLLSQYFSVGTTDITVRPELRAVTLFSHHNVFQDPPFINVDLVSIRNLLIYFNLALQERVLSRLHYAMAAGALLFVGTSETVGEMGVFFEGLQGADKVYIKRRGISGELSIDPSVRGYRGGMRSYPANEKTHSKSEQGEKRDLSLARAVAPNGMICTQNGNIIEVLGDLSPFMEIRAGASTSLNVRMLIDPLRTEATSLIAVAIRNSARRTGRWHRVSLPVGNQVQLQVFPFMGQRGGEPQCLIGVNARFEDVSDSLSGDIENLDHRSYVEKMELEIKSTQEALQQTIEELQTANEELQSSNEELQSTNEEFQATNEELETSNEELQSTNEELLTVNEELQISSAERQALASELEATMTSAPYSVALADQALMVRRMSRIAMDFFGVGEIPPTGIHLSQCNLPSGFPALAPIANTVLRVQEQRRVPVLSRGSYYTMLMSPVHDVHRKLIGLSITITKDVSDPMNLIVDMMSKASNIAHWSYNLDTQELVWSSEMFTIHGRSDSGDMLTWDDTINMIHPADRSAYRSMIDALLDEGTSQTYAARVFGPEGRIVKIKGSITLIRDSEGEPVQMVGVTWDDAAGLARDIQLSSLEAVQDDLGIGFYSFDIENNIGLWSKAMYELLGFVPERHPPSVEALLKRVVEDQRDSLAEDFQAVLERGEPFDRIVMLQNEAGEKTTCTCRGRARSASDGRVSHVFGSLRLLTDAEVAHQDNAMQVQSAS
ncbi:chemotaxis protein CheB [Tateyamaria omphalii]|uniref:protein-glutamate O-methyltransferase n=1 Tax=Tateyamaria omphalii TaxID=299262 RepID=A0A1P8MST5_9RHOB|nr:chemotaxis protein CheB [Tateyamaria omphalii]APX11136.1 chemotaxis protein CheR [Tateyamaria omphalii]